jgi:RND family efflux transporter MFP subunit
VTKGEVIAELDLRNYQENLLKAESAVKEAQANFDFAKRNCEHSAEMFAKGMMGKQEYEKALMDKDVAEARLKFAEANCQTARLALDACQIKAPYDGHIVRRIASEWEYVKAGQPLLEVAEDLKLLAVVNMSSVEATGIKPGAQALFLIDETKTETPGTLFERSGAVNPAGRTLEVKFLIDNKDGRLLPGMSGVLRALRNP